MPTPAMTLAWLLLILLLTGGVAGWWVHRRWRAGNVAAVTVAPAAAAIQPDGPTNPEHDAQAMSSGSGMLARMYAIAFEDEPAEGARVDPADPAHPQVTRAASALLSRIEPGSRYAPRRPQLLPRLLNAVNDEDSSGREIAAIIGRDPALAGNLLRIANSALYRVQPEPIENIERAVVRIGTDGLRQMIAVALMQPVMSGGRGAFGQLPTIVWEHTLLSAAATAEHARHIERVDAFTAQMLGLLHGLGAIVVVQVVRDSYARHSELAPDPGVVGRLLERWAAPTAQRLAQDWALTPRIALALDDQRRDTPLRDLSPLGRSLRIARGAAAAAMLHRSGHLDPDAAFLVLQRLGLREDAATRIWQRIAGS